MILTLSRRDLLLMAAAGLVPGGVLPAAAGPAPSRLRLGLFEDVALARGLAAHELEAMDLVRFSSWRALWDAVTVESGAPLDGALLPEALMALGAPQERGRLRVLPGVPAHEPAEAGLLMGRGPARPRLALARALALPEADAALRAALEAAGFAPRAVDFVELPACQIAAHVEAGAVEAAFVTGPRCRALARDTPPGLRLVPLAAPCPALRLVLRRDRDDALLA